MGNLDALQVYTIGLAKVDNPFCSKSQENKFGNGSSSIQKMSTGSLPSFSKSLRCRQASRRLNAYEKWAKCPGVACVGKCEGSLPLQSIKNEKTRERY